MYYYIDVIRRNGKLEYRCANNSSNSYEIGNIVDNPSERQLEQSAQVYGKDHKVMAVEEPTYDLEEAISRIITADLRYIKKLSERERGDFNEETYSEERRRTWKERIGEMTTLGVNCQGIESYIDIDRYKEIVEKITSKEGLKDFSLEKDQIEVLNQSVDYLMNKETKLNAEDRHPSRYFDANNGENSLWNTLGVLVGDSELCEVDARTKNLSEEEAKVLREVGLYVHHLCTSYSPY
jgi:hypothetical protein